MSVTDYDLRCRICLKQDHKSLSLFKTQEKFSYAQMLQNILNVEASD